MSHQCLNVPYVPTKCRSTIKTMEPQGHIIKYMTFIKTNYLTHFHPHKKKKTPKQDDLEIAF